MPLSFQVDALRHVAKSKKGSSQINPTAKQIIYMYKHNFGIEAVAIKIL